MSDVLFVVENMRAIDRREIYPLQAVESAGMIAAFVEQSEAWRVFYHGSSPAAVMGACELRSGVWSVFCFGTDDWRHVVVSVTRWARARLRPWLQDRAHRIEAHSHVEHVEAHRWLEGFGAVREATLRGFGKDGSDYHVYSWVRD